MRQDIFQFSWDLGIFFLFSERSEAEGRARGKRKAEGPELRPGCKALRYWDGKKYERYSNQTFGA